MFHHGNLKIRRYLRYTAMAVVVTGVTSSAGGQQFEAPAAAPVQGEAVRIVDDRPALHFIKRNLHPVTWVDRTFKPILRLAEGQSSQFLSGDSESPAKVAGIKFGIDKAGSSSGIGPEIKPFHRNFLGTGIQVEMPLLVTYKRYESYRFITSVPVVSRDDTRLLSLEFSAGYR